MRLTFPCRAFHDCRQRIICRKNAKLFSSEYWTFTSQSNISGAPFAVHENCHDCLHRIQNLLPPNHVLRRTHEFLESFEKCRTCCKIWRRAVPVFSHWFVIPLGCLFCLGLILILILILISRSWIDRLRVESRREAVKFDVGDWTTRFFLSLRTSVSCSFSHR